MNINEYKEIEIDKVLSQFGVDKNVGLSQSEVEKRLKKYGYNQLPEYKESLASRIFRRFWGPIPWMIEIAGVLSFLVHHYSDFFIIIIMLFVNAILDFYQEHKALNAIEALKSKLAKKSLVLRDGKWQEIPAKELVAGDIIKIKIGDIVPADLKLIDGDFGLFDQSSLTGESLPKNKKKGDIAYSNSILKQGEMIGIVVATGLNSYFGKTFKLVAKANQNHKSHFQKMVINVGNFLILLSILLVMVIILVGIHRGENIYELLEFSLVLAVSAIPVALPAVLTVVMAVGAVNLAKKQAIVSKLSAIEELAGMDILCSDKTGTLTQNKMSIGEVFLVDGYKEKDLFYYAVLASKKENNDPIEKPIFEIAQKNSIENNLKLKKFIPFDPVRKRVEAIYEMDNDDFMVVKGAPQVVLSLSFDNFNKSQIENKIEEFANKGFRTIGVGYKKASEDKYHFVGLIPLYDPPRVDSKDTILEANQNGVEVKMVTGDNIAVAKYISKVLGIGENIYSIRELKNETHDEYLVLTEIISKSLLKSLNLSEEEIKNKVVKIVNEVKSEIGNKLHKGMVKRHESEIVRIIEEANGFAEVYPEDKYFIVDELQKANHIVAMTGDGVNDAPALKKADIGIAVSGATDAARASADIVLMAKGLKVITDAIKEARTTFERMKSYTIFRIAETIRIIIFMTLSIVVFNFYPITALMIIILALLNDIPILAIAYDNTKIDKKPVKWDMKEMIVLSSWLGIAGVFSSFLIFYLLKVGDISFLPDIPKWVNFNDENSYIAFIQAVFFAKMVVAGHGTIYNTRISDWFFKKPYPSLTLFLATFLTRVIGTIIAVYGFGFMTPIGWDWAIFIWIYAMIWFVFNDFVKKVVIKYYKKRYNEEII